MKAILHGRILLPDCEVRDKTLLDDEKAYERMSKAVNPYGDGKACNRIVRALKGEQVDRYEVK